MIAKKQLKLRTTNGENKNNTHLGADDDQDVHGQRGHAVLGPTAAHRVAEIYLRQIVVLLHVKRRKGCEVQFKFTTFRYVRAKMRGKQRLSCAEGEGEFSTARQQYKERSSCRCLPR